MRQRKVILVDDDNDLIRALKPALEDANFAVFSVNRGQEAVERIISGSPDAVVLDVGLPDLDGFEVCRNLRESGHSVPILLLTSRSSETDRITGFISGADDYVVKPFSVVELVFRVKALLRRAEAGKSAMPLAENDEITIGALQVQPRRRHAFRDGEELRLSAIEFDILHFLAKNKGTPFSREQLMEQIWAVSSSKFAATVTTQLSRLRKKIEPDPTNPRYLLTVYGIGYRLVDPDEDVSAE